MSAGPSPESVTWLRTGIVSGLVLRKVSLLLHMPPAWNCQARHVPACNCAGRGSLKTNRRCNITKRSTVPKSRQA